MGSKKRKQLFVCSRVHVLFLKTNLLSYFLPKCSSVSLGKDTAHFSYCFLLLSKTKSSAFPFKNNIFITRSQKGHKKQKKERNLQDVAGEGSGPLLPSFLTSSFSSCLAIEHLGWMKTMEIWVHKFIQQCKNGAKDLAGKLNKRWRKGKVRKTDIVTIRSTFNKETG